MVVCSGLSVSLHLKTIDVFSSTSNKSELCTKSSRGGPMILRAPQLACMTKKYPKKIKSNLKSP